MNDCLVPANKHKTLRMNAVVQSTTGMNAVKRILRVETI
jgi:hypothetical protein